jgi:hypothetical protein
VAPSPRLDSSEQIRPGGTVEGWAAYLVGVDERDLLVIAGDSLSGDARIIALTPGARLEPDAAAAAVAPNNVGADPREPADVGDVAVSERWEVTVSELLRGALAWERILERYSGADPAPDGMEYVLAYVRVRYLGDGDAPELIAASFFSGLSGAEELDQPVVLEPEPELFAKLFPGGGAEGWVAVAVLEGDETARLAFRGISISTENRSAWHYFALP